MGHPPGLAVVITGASSGVGRATAHAFARRGASLALAARARAPLEDAADECAALGGRAIVVPTDVTDAAAVRRRAEVAAERFVGIAVWVKNAGLGAMAASTRCDRGASPRHRDKSARLHVRRARGPAAFHRARTRGADQQRLDRRLRADSLRGRLRRQQVRAARLLLQPAPGARALSRRPRLRGLPVLHGYAGRAARPNYTGRALQPAPPVYAPETTAEAIVDLARRPRREVVVGAVARLAKLQYQLAPRLVDWVLGRLTEAYLNRAEPSPVTAGNLYEPMPERAGLHGGWRRSLPRGSSATLALGVIGAAAAGIMLAARPAQGGGSRPGSRRWAAAAPPETRPDGGARVRRADAAGIA